jgi:hypothetical protein
MPMRLSTSTLAIFATLESMGIVGVVGVAVSLLDAEAAGCHNPHAPGGGSIAFNASKGRCAR